MDRRLCCRAITIVVVTIVVSMWCSVTARAQSLLPTTQGPEQSDHAAAIRYAHSVPDAAPAGANDAGCRPTSERPRPVILVHGSDASAYADWAGLSPALTARGYCVFALNYGASPDGRQFGYADIVDSAHQLADVVDQVRRELRVSAVDLIGYSQGAAVTRYYTNRLEGNTFVDNWIGVASPTYGGSLYGLVPLADKVPGGTGLLREAFTPAVGQLAQGSDFLTELNAGGDTVPGVQYTSIATDVDETIQPFTNALLRDPGANNIVVQDLCPGHNVAHFTFTYDPFTWQLILNALDPASAIDPPCTTTPIGAGIVEVVIAGQ